MRSKASFKGHPLHPVLIPFPIAFLTGSVVFDIWGRASANQSLWTTGGYLAIAGIGTALLAAVPGFIDYLYTVPPDSSGKKRATLHMGVNLTSVLLFTVAALLRGGPAHEPVTIAIGLQVLALVLLGMGGWMGGTLVGRNQISVDHRYAESGKWKEATIDAKGGETVVVAAKDELKVNQMKLLHVNGKRIALGRTEQGYVAFTDRCPHKGGSLAGGVMMGGRVMCPWHGSQFDAASGGLVCGPATIAIKTYAVVEKNGEVTLKLT